MVRTRTQVLDFYALLGVARDANDSEIKKAFRSLAKDNHPDKGGDTEAFRRIEEAYRTLMHPADRVEYDQRLYESENAGEPGVGSEEPSAPTGDRWVANAHGVRVPDGRTRRRWQMGPRWVSRMVTPGDQVLEVPPLDPANDVLDRDFVHPHMLVRVLSWLTSGPPGIRLRGRLQWMYAGLIADVLLIRYVLSQLVPSIQPVWWPLMAAAGVALWCWWPLRLAVGFAWTRRPRPWMAIPLTLAVLAVSGYLLINISTMVVVLIGLVLLGVTKLMHGTTRPVEQWRANASVTIHEGMVCWVDMRDADNDDWKTRPAVIEIVDKKNGLVQVLPSTSQAAKATSKLWNARTQTGWYLPLRDAIDGKISWIEIGEPAIVPLTAVRSVIFTLDQDEWEQLEGSQ